MSEKVSAVKALAAMIREHGEPTVDEVVFVAHAALELGLDPDENESVQKILKEGGDFGEHLADIESDDIKMFLFRRIVSAALIDSEINDSEKHYIAKTAESFGFDDGVVEEYVSWMCEGIDWERRGFEIMGRLGKE